MECRCVVYPEASTVVSQPLQSSPMAGKSLQPIHSPPFQEMVFLTRDESVEGDIEDWVNRGWGGGGGGNAKTTSCSLFAGLF